MGQLIALWKGRDEDIYIDFENARPTEKEAKIFTQVEDEVLKRGNVALNLIENYKGCQDLVRKAMSTPTLENERIAFEGLLVVVDFISEFYVCAKKLEVVVPMLLDTLSKQSLDESKENKMAVEQQQALAKQFGEVLDFTLRFDQLRMNRPQLSNDFAYYRRLLPKFHDHPDIKVKDDDASGMALFTAEHIPMMKSLCRAAQTSLSRNGHVTTTLAVMANACFSMLKHKKFERPERNLFIARAMTGSIVLYDHVHPFGAFSKRSEIHIKHCIMLLKKDFPSERSFMNAIQFSSKTFKDAPPAIQELFE